MGEGHRVGPPVAERQQREEQGGHDDGDAHEQGHALEGLEAAGDPLLCCFGVFGGCCFSKGGRGQYEDACIHAFIHAFIHSFILG